MDKDPIPGLYEQLVTQDLKRLLKSLKTGQVTLDGPDIADAYVAMSEHLRRIIEHTLRAIPEEDRLIRQAELCNELISWLQKGSARESTTPGEALIVPVEVLREIKSIDRVAAFSQST